MSYRTNLAWMGYVSNATYLNAWAEKIGQFILNFGGIELLTYQYLVLLEQSQDAFERNFDRLLAERITRITALIADANVLLPAQRDAAIALWSSVRELSKWRNRIAHNPVLPTWESDRDPVTDPPDALGIPDVRKFRDGGDGDQLSLQDIQEMVDASADLSRELHGFTRTLRGAA